MSLWAFQRKQEIWCAEIANRTEEVRVYFPASEHSAWICENVKNDEWAVNRRFLWLWAINNHKWIRLNSWEQNRGHYAGAQYWLWSVTCIPPYWLAVPWTIIKLTWLIARKKHTPRNRQVKMSALHFTSQRYDNLCFITALFLQDLCCSNNPPQPQKHTLVSGMGTLITLCCPLAMDQWLHV